MDKLSVEDLKQAVERLLEVLTCPVCLATVRTNAVLCTNGHAVCSECKIPLNQCPTCQVPFSNVKATLINQVVEVLPHPCRYECSEVVKSKDDHEKFCTFKLTTCKVCQKVCRGKDILEHVKEKHPTTKVLKTENIFLFGIEQGNCMILENPSVFNNVKNVACTSVNGKFFWVLMEKNNQLGLVFIRFSCVPCGKPVNNWIGHVELRSNNSQYTMEIKLNLDPEVNLDENSIAVPVCMLPKFITDKNCVHFHIQINSSKFV